MLDVSLVFMSKRTAVKPNTPLVLAERERKRQTTKVSAPPAPASGCVANPTRAKLAARVVWTDFLLQENVAAQNKVALMMLRNN